MAYTPPASTSIDFALVAYTPPASTSIDFDLSDSSSASPGVADVTVTALGPTAFNPGVALVTVTAHSASAGAVSVTPGVADVLVTGVSPTSGVAVAVGVGDVTVTAAGITAEKSVAPGVALVTVSAISIAGGLASASPGVALVTVSTTSPRAAPPPPYYVLYSDGAPFRIIPGAATTFNLSTGPALADGVHTLGLTRVDAYGNESSAATITTHVSSGTAALGLVTPQRVIATRMAGGVVRLTWLSVPDATHAQPVEFELSDASAPSTIIATITAGSSMSYTADVTYSDGATAALRVRGSNGAGRVTDWIAANVVVADADPPPVPVIVG